MKKTILYSSLILFIVSCNTGKDSSELESDKEILYKIETSEGNILIKLYEETPLHTSNFDKLTTTGFYDDLLFHRIIKNFMIQTGDPESSNAAPGVMLGNGGPDYTIPAEIHPNLYHKKGAVAAARLGDDINPERASSGSQFYIVHGTTHTDEILDKIENQINQQRIQLYYKNILDSLKNDVLENDLVPDYSVINPKAKELATEKYNSNKFSFTEEQRKVYKTQGGTPHLDGGYTVFGEVVEGMDVVEKIAASEADNNDRPLKDISIQIEKIEK